MLNKILNNMINNTKNQNVSIMQFFCIFLVACIIAGITSCSSNKSQPNALFPYWDNNGKIGLIDETGKVIFQPQFDSFSDGITTTQGSEVRDFHYTEYHFPEDGGLLPVVKDNKVGFIDKTGKWVAKPQFDDVSFYDGIWTVSITDGDHEQYGLINGDIVVSPKYDFIGDFYEGLASARIDDEAIYINKTGDAVFSLNNIENWNVAGDFHDGLAKVESNDKYGYINHSGKIVIAPQFDYASGFYDGLAKVEIDLKCGFINKEGEFVISPKDYYFSSYGDFHEGLCWIKNDSYNENHNKYGFIDKTGNVVIDYQFDQVEDFHDGLAIVKIDGKEGMIDKNGNIVIKPEYDFLGYFHDGVAGFENKSGYSSRRGYINKSGQIIINPQDYEYVGNIDDDMIIVEQNGKCGFVNKDGEMVIKPQYDYCSKFHEGFASVAINKKWGIIDKTGKMVVKTQYECTCPFYNGLAFAKIADTKYAYIDKAGKIVFEFETNIELDCPVYR